MKTLELKHLAPYLPYNLKVQYDNGLGLSTTYIVSPNKDVLYTLKENEHIQIENLINEMESGSIYKSILHPLSDLTKEIEHGGERFVPALKLAEIAVKNGYYTDIAPTEKFSCKIVKKPFGEMLKVTKLDDWVILISFSDLGRSRYWIIKKLFEWHFDVFDLIKDGMAIDINSLK